MPGNREKRIFECPKCSFMTTLLEDEPPKHYVASPRVIIDIVNPDALGRGSRIVLDVEDDARAIEVAQKLADATGRAVTVRDAPRGMMGRHRPRVDRD